MIDPRLYGSVNRVFVNESQNGNYYTLTYKYMLQED